MNTKRMAALRRIVRAQVPGAKLERVGRRWYRVRAGSDVLARAALSPESAWEIAEFRVWERQWAEVHSAHCGDDEARSARLRVISRESGYLSDPHRQPSLLGRVRSRMGKRRARKALRIKGKHARKRWARYMAASRLRTTILASWT